MASPVIHYTFDTDGTNSGTSGSTDDTSGTISTTNKFIGAGSLETTNETRSTIPKYNFTSYDTKGITFSFWLKHDGSVIDKSYYLYSCHPSSTSVTGGSWSELDTLRYSYSASDPNLQLYTTNPGGGSANSSTKTDEITSAESDPIFDGNWHHVAVSYDAATLNGSNQRIRKTTVYIDNTIVCYADDWVGGLPDNQNNILIIGETYMSSEGTYNKPWPGNYDDFRMYDYALTNSQITNVYKSGLIDSGLNLLSLVNSGTLTIEDFVLHGYTVAQLLAIGFSQVEIYIALTQIKIHTAFTISDGTNSSSFATTDAVYTPANFAAKLTTDLGYAENTITVGIDTTSYYRMYLQFANAVTLTGMPKYIFNIPFNDFSLKAGGQVSLRNVNLDTDMTFNLTKPAISQAQIGPNLVGLESDENFAIWAKLNNDGTILFSSSNNYDSARGRVIAYKYKIPTSTEWSNANIVIKGTDTSQVTDKLYWTQRGAIITGKNTGDYFGEKFDIDDTGNFIAVGAREEDGIEDNGSVKSKSGSLRVYEYKIPTSTEWSNADIYKDSDSNQVSGKFYWTQVGNTIYGDNANDQWSYGVAMNGDGSRISWCTRTTNGDGARLEVYQRDLTNTTIGWTKLGGTIFKEDDGTGGGGGFGFKHRLNDVGDFLVIDDIYYKNVYFNVGKAWVYKYKIPTTNEWGTTNMVMKDGDTNQVSGKLYWTKIGEFEPGGSLTATMLYGEGVDINKTGSRVAFTCRVTDNGGGEGQVEVFEYSGSGTTWTQIGDIRGTGEGITGESGLLNRMRGADIAMNSTGNIIAFSGREHTVNDVSKPGIIGIAEYKNGNWEYIGNDIIGLNKEDRFGNTISIGGNKISVGSNRFNGGDADGTHIGRGMLQVYQIEEQAFSHTSTITAGNHFINNFVSKLDTDISSYSLSYDEPNNSIVVGDIGTDISFSITSADTTIFDTSITEMTSSTNTLPFITYGQSDSTNANYIDTGITISTYLSNGYTIPQLYKEGVIPDWTVDTDANHFAQSYVKDFIDISGSLALRENSSLTVNGNIETKGNITIKNPTMAADLSLNHNMTVSGDISMNGNVTVGDISMNGKVVDCSFTDASIPESAFNGQIGPDYTQPTILYEKGFDTTADVSMNANVQINNLKVDGNIEFSDGTTMNTYDDNKSVSYGAQLLESNLTITHNSTYVVGVTPMRCSADGKYSIVHYGDLNIIINNNYNGTTATKSAILLSSDYGKTYNAITLPTMPVISSTYNNITGITGDNDFTKVDFKCMGISPSGKNIIIGISGTEQTTNNWTNTSVAWSLDYGETWETHYIKEILGTAITGQQSSWVLYPTACVIDDAGKIAIATDKTNQFTGGNGKGIFYSVDRTPGSFMYSSSYPGDVYGLDITNNEIAFATQGNFYKLSFTGVLRSVSVPSINNTYYKYSVSQYVGNDGLCAIFTLGWQSNTSLISPCYFIKDDGTTLTAIDKSTTIAGVFTDTAKYNRMASVMSASGKYIMIGGADGFQYATENVNIREAGWQVYYSEDYGATFTMMSLELDSLMPVAFIRNIVITDNGYIYAKYSNRETSNFKFSLFKASTFTSLTINNTLTAGSFSTSSDYRIKTDISQLDETITLDNLRPVKYLQTLINKPQYGLIAHELQEYYPDLVVGKKDGKEWQKVNYTGLIALLINEIKQLKRELTELENGM